MEAAKSRLNPKDRPNCFELFGFDFMLDSDLKCWLIEVNTNPCLEESSPLLGKLLPRMIDDLLKITMDKVFAPLPVF
jgi:Tubulin-tyrosine ligase family